MPDHTRLTRSDAQRPNVGMVHLGPGAFFRAFNAVYSNDAMAVAGGDWGIRAVSLRSPDMRDRLAPQDFAYNAVTLAPDGPQYQVIEAICDVLVAPEAPTAVLQALADPVVRIVSMTITEKGYCHNPATGELRLDHPDIVHDLAHPGAPRSAVGFLVYALAQRRAAGVAPFTILSCDNLPDNGSLTRRVVLAFARAVDPDIAAWIAVQARFPATMVDRITPATTQTDIAAIADATGSLDLGCVMHEPFRQWVIEDDFVGGVRPDWGQAGAQFVRDVASFETMKLRCLNGTHSMLAYLGYLAGYDTIAETVADPGFAALLDQIWTQEIIPTVPQPEGEDLQAYCAALMTRYRNPAIRHRTLQIAMDGSQKLPQRILGTITDNLRAGRACPGLILAVAGWLRFVGGIDEKGQQIEVKDPLAAQLRTAFDAGHTAAQKVDHLLAMRDVFGADLIGHADFRDRLTISLTDLLQEGAIATIQKVLTDVD